MIKDSWKESGKIHGYRKIHDDLIEMGERVSANRVARLADIQAQIGYNDLRGGAKPLHKIKLRI